MEELLGVCVPPPRESFEIREVHVTSALRRDPLPGIDYSFNPYIGCYHGCTFCYVPRLLQIDRNKWGASVVVKRNAATVLAKELRRLPRGLVAISTATDPYQFVEGKYRITRHSLEVLLRAQWPVSVLSRAPLMIRDLDLFRQFPEIEVGMSVPTLDDAARALLEPWAPPIDARLRCLRALADAGLTTFVGVAPACRRRCHAEPAETPRPDDRPWGNRCIGQDHEPVVPESRASSVAAVRTVRRDDDHLAHEARAS